MKQAARLVGEIPGIIVYIFGSNNYFWLEIEHFSEEIRRKS